MNVSPVAEENLFVYSCSSDKIGLVSFAFVLPWNDLPNLDPDLAEGANLICLPSSDGELLLSSSCCYLASSSYAFCTSLLIYGATWLNGSKLIDWNLKAVFIPERFFRINFYEEFLLMVQAGKYSIFSF